MKKLMFSSFLAAALAFSMAQANAGTLNVTLDEYGNGSSNGTPLTSFVAGDITGGAASALFYQLPFPVVQGDVILDEPGGNIAVVLSDVLRFFTLSEGSYVAFYSDNGDGVDATADISGLPGNAPFTNIVTISEVGLEAGPNGAIYTPTSGQPGFINVDNSATYNILSDSTAPEPGSLLLIGAGLAGLGLLRHYRR